MTSPWERTGAPRGDAYDDRWRALEAAGHDPHGEAAFVQRYAPARVLDAGCGTGRVAIELARRGLHVVGVDRDAAMLESARRKAPALTWIVQDLATLALDERFDVAVMAGNVMLFVDPRTEAAVIARVAAHLSPAGRLIAGFELGRRVGLAEYDAAAGAAGLELESRFATWDGDPFVPGGDYAVSVHRHCSAPAPSGR